MRIVTEKIPSTVEGKAQGWRYYEREDQWASLPERRHIATVFRKDDSWTLEIGGGTIVGIDSPQTADEVVRSWY